MKSYNQIANIVVLLALGLWGLELRPISRALGLGIGSGFIDVHSLSSKRATKHGWNPLSATRTSLSCHRRNAATCHSRGGGAKNKCDTWVLAIHFLSIPNLDFWPDPSLTDTCNFWFRRWSHPYLQLLHTFTVIWDFQKSFTNPSLFLGYSMPLDRIISSVFGQTKPRVAAGRRSRCGKPRL